MNQVSVKFQKGLSSITFLEICETEQYCRKAQTRLPRTISKVLLSLLRKPQNRIYKGTIILIIY
jgi:hypothetical protein